MRRCFGGTALALSAVLVWGVIRDAPPLELGAGDPRAQMNHSWVIVSSVLGVIALLTQSYSMARCSHQHAARGLWWPPHNSTATCALWVTSGCALTITAIWGVQQAVAAWPVNLVLAVSV